MRELGLIIQLGHDGKSCPCPAPKCRRIAVGDLSGTHLVYVRFCECLDPDDLFLPEWVQLMRRGWFPATTNRPATVFTFRMLDFFQELNFTAKANLFDFWRTLERVTDNSGSYAPLVCFFLHSSMPHADFNNLESLQAAVSRSAFVEAPYHPQASCTRSQSRWRSCYPAR